MKITTRDLGEVCKHPYRLSSIDMLRGLAIVLMAIDHSRNFFHANGTLAMLHPTFLLFLTRWITNFCAPVFVLLAGTSAGLMTIRKSPRQLGWLLFTRGLWLIFIECVLISNGWDFSPGGITELGGRYLIVLQVIWALGVSMLVLAGAQFLGKRTCLIIGAIILLGHNMLDPIWPASGPDWIFKASPTIRLWVALHSQMSWQIGSWVYIIFLYPLLPWIGVMLVGFGSSTLFTLPELQRKRFLILIGLGMILAFFVLRCANIYGDPHPAQWGSNLTLNIISFLDVTKYPPSLDFLLITLGPAAIFCAYAENMNGWLKSALVMFGRVPFFFYVLHIYLLHALAVLLGMMQGFTFSQMATSFIFFPKGYGLPLIGVYLVWFLVLLMLYPLCRWFAKVKAHRQDWWLSYL
jgi:uncharacterized membrane protein